MALAAVAGAAVGVVREQAAPRHGHTDRAVDKGLDLDIVRERFPAIHSALTAFVQNDLAALERKAEAEGANRPPADVCDTQVAAECLDAVKRIRSFVTAVLASVIASRAPPSLGSSVAKASKGSRETAPGSTSSR